MYKVILIIFMIIWGTINVYDSSFIRFFYYRFLPVEKITKLDVISDENLQTGKLEMSKHKVVFAGITRSNAPHLPNAMRHIEYIGQFFSDYRIIIFENDSTDSTKLMLNLWQLINHKVKIISQDFFNQKRPSIKFLADIRNKYLEILNTSEFDEFDIVIILDMDIGYGIDIRGILDSFSKIDRWDVVCSNGIFNSKGQMYDAFAFRNEEFSYTPYEYNLKTGKSYFDTENLALMQKIYPPDSDLLPVNSCFNSLTIYKRKFFENCFYDSIKEDCEHVYLHECMRSKHNARIFMNPVQIIRYEHYR
ncbi:hypothetical protein PQ676_00595 [Rickettsia felis]|uniref:Glycosyl transferase 2 family protein n=3 Tax=Rickettsia felis TaxID=42862 RepID=Q4UMY3_RICFE|nr:hypothetical protein [Rickettsia felis]AAY61075.1 unknown [Rickettsia felis URRWXCal2]MDE8610769.1 hypothetical protein [Rickettsia felis]